MVTNIYLGRRNNRCKVHNLCIPDGLGSVWDFVGYLFNLYDLPFDGVIIEWNDFMECSNEKG